MNCKKTTDPFGLPNEGKFDINAPNRERYGQNDETVPDFAPLDRAGYGIGSRDLKRFLGAAAQQAQDAQRPSRLTLHTSSGALRVQITRRGTLWVAFVPWQGAWREFQAESYEKLVAYLMGTFNPGPSVRELTPAEELSAARLCASGKPDDALILYVRGRCGDVTAEMVDDPQYRRVTDAAAWFVFRHSTNDYADTQEARAFMDHFVGDRPVTVPLLRAAFAAWKQGQGTNIERHANDPHKQPDTDIDEAQLNALSDNQVADLYRGVVREGAQHEMQFRRILRGQ